MTTLDHTGNFQDFFKDVSYKNFKKFKKMVNERFEGMNEFVDLKNDGMVNLVEQCSQQIYQEFTQVYNMCLTGNVNTVLIQRFITKFAHFILFATNILNCISYSRNYYYQRIWDSKSDLSEVYVVQGRIWASMFMILKNISDFHQYCDQDTIRNSEMSVLYFLEWFSTLSIDDISFPCEINPAITTTNKIFNATVENVNSLFTDVESYHLL